MYTIINRKLWDVTTIAHTKKRRSPKSSKRSSEDGKENVAINWSHCVQLFTVCETPE